ncbi:MAG TPA: ATP-binding cassette domain-containing protein [Anaerolineales bacterium]|nr:ATP-binding cassette domain-containing protein [Anaerolineales bacterium]
MAAILEVEGLVKKFGQFSAVKGISFSVERGEVFGLLGPNGAGKTTIISMLTGTSPPTSGTARIGGYDLASDPLPVKRLIGLVPQELALYPTLSARANLNFFGGVYGLRGAELKSRVEDVLAVVALSERADEPIEKYSGGMKRRANIAAGLVHQPELLFLDEPTVGVDPQSRNHIFESVLKLNHERGMTIIYTSHYMEEVELLCNRVAIIDQGQIIALDTIKNLVGMLGGGVLHVGLRSQDESLLGQIAALPAVSSAVRLSTASQVEPAGPLVGDGNDGAAGIALPESDVLPVKIECEHSQQALIHLIRFLNGCDINIASLEILEPNLESVFLHLTGKKLRE